jgi:DNA topoisomerase-1
VKEELARRRALGSRHVERVVFHEITKSAVLDAIAHPRELNQEMVEAYLARRALDYLVGFTLSPILWRKLPGSRSAGRVQSVALRLVCERESEIESFVPQEYWSIEAACQTAAGKPFTARVNQWQGKRLDRLGIKDKAMADEIVAVLQGASLTITSVEKRQVRRNPPPPFTTSTLQQEASRKLRFAASQTMRIAQKLYEGIDIGGETAGLITYMRTDSVNLSNEALGQARDLIAKRYSAPYLPDKPRTFANKAKNAQEAHECIRPTDMARDAASLKLSDDDQRKLYDLIWKRTLACQMEGARMERTTVDIASDDGQVELRATGQVVLFDGFLRVYEEGRDDVVDDDDKLLPQIAEGEAATKKTITPEQHFTQPPPRYTEATLVKKMEELGIGRPSTYASVITTIQDREYVRKDKNRLIPEDKGRIVTIFLLNFFRQYVGYEFTANLEEELDDVSAGNRDYKNVLARFWKDFSVAIAETSELRITEVLDVLDAALAPTLYPPREDGSDPRQCPLCGTGQLHLKTSRSGGFVGCGNYPECRYTRPIGGDAGENGDRILGADDAGNEISLRSGRFGPYVQRGEATEENKKPDRASLPKGWTAEAMTLDKALTLLSLPRAVGQHPEGGMISANFGRFGPYLMHQLPDEAKPVYANLKDPNDVFEIGMNRAVELLAAKRANPGGRGRAAAKALRDLGEHPEHGGPIQILEGRYGPYIKWDKVNATLPKGTEPEDVTMEMAVEAIAAKATKPGKARKTAAKKPAAKAKATATKKPAAKKAPAKRAAAGK